MECLIRELKAAAGNGVEAIGCTPADSSSGRSPTSAVLAIVWGEAQPGVFEVLLCYDMDELICAAFYTINAPRLKTAPFKTTTNSLETPQTSPEYDAPLFDTPLSRRANPVPNHDTCLTKCFGVRFHPVSSADEDWFITDI